MGFDLSDVSYDLQNIKKLKDGRIDLWAADELNGYFVIKENQYKTKDFTTHLPLDFPKGIYLAFSKTTSDELVESFRASLVKIKENGIYDKIIAKYK